MLPGARIAEHNKRAGNSNTLWSEIANPRAQLMGARRLSSKDFWEKSIFKKSSKCPQKNKINQQHQTKI